MAKEAAKSANVEATVTGKVVGIWPNNISLNIGKSKLLSVPRLADDGSMNFRKAPEIGQLVEFKHDGLTCKKYSDGTLSKTIGAKNFRHIDSRTNYVKEEYVEEAEVLLD